MHCWSRIGAWMAQGRHMSGQWPAPVRRQPRCNGDVRLDTRAGATSWRAPRPKWLGDADLGGRVYGAEIAAIERRRILFAEQEQPRSAKRRHGAHAHCAHMPRRASELSPQLDHRCVRSAPTTAIALMRLRLRIPMVSSCTAPRKRPRYQEAAPAWCCQRAASQVRNRE
jgi:hypothetical protein